MNLVFWLNSTFLHCSYLTLFTPQIFGYHYRFHCLLGITVVSRELNQKKIQMHFFFGGGGEGDEVGGEKGVLQWWIVEKKSHIAGLKSVS